MSTAPRRQPALKPDRIDPITSSVIQGALENIAVEMGYKLMRMSYSSIIRESEDFGAALVDAEGRGLAESAQSTPLQSGPIPGYVRGIQKILASRGDVIRPGDVIMHNDAYSGASHGPDVAFIVPVFVEGRLIAFAATTAHHLDIGALSPGSCGIVEAIDAYAEGLQFKAIKVYDRGVRNDMVWQIVRDNIRASDLVVGDMDAQIAAARIGAERMVELVERYGLETFDLACTALMDHAERLMRQAIARLPDGIYRAETAIDGYLDSDDPAKKELPIVVTITKKDDSLVVDLTGTAPQVPDRPINMPLEGTADIAIWLTIRSVLLDTEIHGHIPVNAGLIRPITIVAPKGCLANPTFPAPTIARFCPGNQLADTVMKALSQAMPGNVSAGIGNLKVIAFSGLKDETHWVHMEIFEGSYGGRLGKDGMGSTPVSVLGPVDQHSQLQLFRDGPGNALFTLVSVDTKGKGPAAPRARAKQLGLDYLAGKRLGDLVDAEARATAQTLSKNGRPVRQIHLAKVDEFEMGALMMHFMIETILMGKLMGVDPFDQPGVEEGKVLARQYLKEG